MDLWENIYYRFVKAFGTVIVEGAIVDMITGEVCFSTQKVRYAPVINGKIYLPMHILLKDILLLMTKLLVECHIV